MGRSFDHVVNMDPSTQQETSLQIKTCVNNTKYRTMQSRWDFILEESYLVREAELGNHMERMLLKRLFKQQTIAFVTGVNSCGFGRRKKKDLSDTGGHKYVWDNKQSRDTCSRIPGCIWQTSGWI